MSEIVKKKRGRKPKKKDETVQPTEKKKRGRKPKNKDIEVKIPKKRGRKPKKIDTKEICKLTEEPIILHLPIKNINPTINDIPKPYLNNTNFKNITTNIDNIKSVVEDEIVYKDNIITKFNDLCNKYNNIVVERDKVFPVFLEFNEYNKKKEWPSCTNIDCLWCCHQFENFPFGIPIKKIEDTYHMFGNFCSAECASAYNFDNNNSYESYERYSLINYIYSNNKKIKLAGPRISLKKFGGQLNINEFRQNNNIYSKNYKLLLPPMISLIPIIEEVNILDCKNINDNTMFNLDENELKLKRSKPLPDSYNTLENCMNLKLV
jgi:hypothetical protein